MDTWLTMDTWLGDVVSVSNDILWTYILVGLLLFLGVFFTIKTRFVQFRMLKEMVVLLFKGTDRTNFKKKQGTTAFQAFTISTAARVGTGNLAGVALAITAGGPGAVFWMWMIALVGAATGFVESTLAQMYKVKDKDGFRGGPAYYMEKALGMRWMGVLFAILITLCFGLIFNAVQTNTISQAFTGAYDIHPGWIGSAIAVLIGIVIFGGIRRIAVVAEFVVPFFAIIYIIVALIVMILNIGAMPEVISLIVSNAFGLQEIAGGGLGAAVMNGVQRGLFSNEAGMGSAPNAAATAHVSHPVKQGLVQTLGVFTDTLIICSSTAFLIILSGTHTSSASDGIQLTQLALNTHLGDWAQTFVVIAIFFFAFSSLLGNYYYGEANIEFMSENPVYVQIFRIAFLIMVMVGAMSELQIIWALADVFMGSMALVNLIAIALLTRIALLALDDYQEQRKRGKEPVFYNDSIPGLNNIEAWNKKPKRSNDK
ncbi:alanine or glycine:cation symporter, AGCS family [Alteribacillus persepolensis]|uniref:Alanine or glycine:cation symporter, AGCS family n=1 Tax=Alteribacillus persepolensis TaxID=568899 RepID=A0A1G8GEK8_9BACI|nr:alanine/glycine:cation symporter family protein [Alteribacillus persepolensis]SDH92819.1 alanine or glycine:cation symporter, AGCS family [Alteribacillus persepolensis]